MTDNVRKTIGGPSLVLVGLALVVAMYALAVSKQRSQPIAFDHKKHTENNVDCIVCHQLYTKSAKAGIPEVQVCRKCHEDVVYVSPEKAKLLKQIQDRGEIPWQRIYRVPPHVLFSHRRHVVAGKLRCAECHGDVARMSSPITSEAITLNMKRCIGCHRANYSNQNECLACHR